MSDYFLDRMYALKGIKAVTDIRGYGMLCGIDLAPAERPGLRGTDATKRLFQRGLHIKFTGDAGICAPALVAEKRDIDEIYTIFREVFSEY
jgi:beta-alanine--pyruvate transaminase